MNWLLLIMSLPTRQASERMRIWRALKQAACLALRDGVYLLPATPDTQALFTGLATDIQAMGGKAQVLPLGVITDEQAAHFRAAFARDADYAELKKQLDTLQHQAGRKPMASLKREWGVLQKTYFTLRAVDYFPGAAATHIEAMLVEIAQTIEARENPDEPQAAPGKVARLDRAPYQRRIWATRKHMWVDRMASAWLILRFIDVKAKFKWLAKPMDCPKRALGFDFDGAAFTHVGQRVTFEVLLASFGLDADPALARIGGIVHFLDVGGVPVPEAAGLVAVLRGLREAAPDDDELLAAVTPVFDGLYAGVQEAA